MQKNTRTQGFCVSLSTNFLNGKFAVIKKSRIFVRINPIQSARTDINKDEKSIIHCNDDDGSDGVSTG